jgi:lactoylglutathione lyase
MAFKLNHVHLKSPDPKQTAQWYVDNLGAKVVSETGNGGFRLDLHGLPLNVTGFIAGQNHEQVYGIEHIAIDTDDLDNTVQHLKSSGARILEETKVGGGRRVCWVVSTVPGSALAWRRAATLTASPSAVYS